MIYRDSITLVGEDRELLPHFMEFLTGIGLITDIKRLRHIPNIVIEFEFGPFSDEPDDMWTMCERAHEVEQELQCWGINTFRASRSKVVPTKTTKRKVA